MSHQAGLEYERSFWDQGKHVVGIDEAGRGPIAGPLVVAGAVFDIGYANSEIYDSKALSEKKREMLFLFPLCGGRWELPARWRIPPPRQL